MTLEIGDVLSTGTPLGVGMGQKLEPIYLKTGQQIRLGVEGLGEQEQKTVAFNWLVWLFMQLYAENVYWNQL